MFYFLFFFLQFIIADENINKNNESPTTEQTIVSTQENVLSSIEGIPNLHSDSLSSDDSKQQTQEISHIPHKTLRRIKETRNIPKITHDDQSTTVGSENPELNQTPQVNPLRRRNAKINIPKIELNDENDTNTQDETNTNQIPPKPDFEDGEAFREDPSDPFDDENDENIVTEEKNAQHEAKKTNLIKNEKAEADTPEQATSIAVDIPEETPAQSPTETLLSEDEQTSVNEENYNTDTDKNNIKSNQESEAKTAIKKKMAKFSIVSISPQSVSTHGDEKIEITMNTTLDGPPFIKFGEDKIVHGRHSKKDLTVKCRTPRLPEGDINVSVSIDKVKWSEPFAIVVVADEADLPWIFVGCAGIAIIAVSLMISKLICGKRAVPKKKKSSTSRNDDIMNILAPNYRSNNLHKRKKTQIEV